eukprot:g15219.t1
MKDKGKYAEKNGWQHFRVCGDTVSLLFYPAPKFHDLANVISSVEFAYSKVNMFMIGGGVHNMVIHGENTNELVSWLLKLAGVKGKNADHVVVVGTHFRIIDLAPKPYRAYAQGPQGNAKIRLWNRLMKRYSGDYKFVDPYNITSSLTKAY